jgi:ATP-dependent HslUV protease ATP-binding subunit HslU
MQTENITLVFAPEGIRRIAEIAWHVNESTENIGARRLYTVMEKLLEDLSFDASQNHGQSISIDVAYVDERLKDLSESEDLARYVL